MWRSSSSTGARSTRAVSVTNETLVLEVRGAAAGATADGADELLLVALNLGDEPLRVADPAPAADGWVAGRDAGLDGDVHETVSLQRTVRSRGLVADGSTRLQS